jgi:CDP-diglyceride synthetase
MGLDVLLLVLQSWLAGVTTWSVGLVATLATVACVIAADTGAYFVGEPQGPHACP